MIEIKELKSDQIISLINNLDSKTLPENVVQNIHPTLGFRLNRYDLVYTVQLLVTYYNTPILYVEGKDKTAQVHVMPYSSKPYIDVLPLTDNQKLVRRAWKKILKEIHKKYPELYETITSYISQTPSFKPGDSIPPEFIYPEFMKSLMQ